jgi:hypothetical protein
MAGGITKCACDEPPRPSWPRARLALERAGGQPPAQRAARHKLQEGRDAGLLGRRHVLHVRCAYEPRGAPGGAIWRRGGALQAPPSSALLALGADLSLPYLIGSSC